MPETERQAAKADSGTILLLAFGAGLSVATLYYNQPILAEIATDLRVPKESVGLVPTVTQLGYGAGIILFAPLGDKLDRRRVILAKSIALALALTGAACAGSLVTLCAASLCIGLLATIAQDFVPAAAALSAPASRGKTVGKVMTGLLLGILLSRLVSGALAARLGWRAVFVMAALCIVTLTVVAWRRLPGFPPSTSAPYSSLLYSIAGLLRREPKLRRAALTQGLLSVAFSGFWSTLAFLVTGDTYRMGSTAAGAFGIAGAIGALLAPVAGSLADKRGPTSVVRVGASLVVVSFAMMGLMQGSLLALVIGAVVFDLGVQASLISHQTVVYALDPAARSRLNAALVSVMFVGMAVGSALASAAYSRFGWSGVCAQGAAAGTMALVLALGKRS